jgi:hypothetical protein
MSGSAYELLPRNSHDRESHRPLLNNNNSDEHDASDDDDPAPTTSTPLHIHTRWLPPALRNFIHRYIPLVGITRTRALGLRGPRKVSISRYVCFAFAAIPVFVLLLVLFVTLFLPSYTSLPPHYAKLQKRVSASTALGRGNVNNEKVFIAATIYDSNGHLIGGEWGRQVLDLIQVLGPDNVFLSIYENDPDPGAEAALAQLRKDVTCEWQPPLSGHCPDRALTGRSALVSEHITLASFPRITLPEGETRLKRIAFLAEMRNRALAPLDKGGVASNTTFDKLLFLNDVYFNPLDVAQLLFSTAQDPETGKTTYAAACAVDFINAFKFYDRFATRGLDGESMGVPFYPWFVDDGAAASRSDVLAEKDAVRVRSCWGGMTAFEASWFQRDISSTKHPFLSFRPNAKHAVPGGIGLNALGALRFRYEADTFWDASECCLIHADLQYARSGLQVGDDTGIYMNPFVRVAYDPDTLSWLGWTRRPERLYSGVHHLINLYASLPSRNPRQKEQPGDIVRDKVWLYKDPGDSEDESHEPIPAGGEYREIERVVLPGRFCGGRGLFVIEEDGSRHGKWSTLPAPAGGRRR